MALPVCTFDVLFVIAYDTAENEIWWLSGELDGNGRQQTPTKHVADAHLEPASARAPHRPQLFFLTRPRTLHRPKSSTLAPIRSASTPMVATRRQPVPTTPASRTNSSQPVPRTNQAKGPASAVASSDGDMPKGANKTGNGSVSLISSISQSRLLTSGGFRPHLKRAESRRESKRRRKARSVAN
jgi:hypothetical protein